MSGWDWIHAGLEVATFTAVQRAQQNVAAMKTTQEKVIAQGEYLAALKNLTFDLTKKIQLVEVQLTEFPQQVYLVAQTLQQRFESLGIVPQIFPDFQDKEYVYQTQQKIAVVRQQAQAQLTPAQVVAADNFLQFQAEMPFLDQAILAKAALEKLELTQTVWSTIQQKRARFLTWGRLSLLAASFTGCALFFALSNVKTGQPPSSLFFLTLLLGVGGAWLLTQGKRLETEYQQLRTERLPLEKQLVFLPEWEKIVKIFGDLPSTSYQALKTERLAACQLISGLEDFRSYF